ncbi:MAG TPA: HNH endonuclease [Steroidobacteraceae bacterium]|nr:HNH endonuclease [Steroidobacteraceae bacterium]
MTQDELKALLYYHPESGDFVRLDRRAVGTQAGSLHHKGYIEIKLLGRMYQAHRLAWFYMTGALPAEVDHRDLSKSNNVWTNLRAATHAQNRQNRLPRRDCSSGVKGVAWYPNYGKWSAIVVARGQRYFLGYFADKDAAVAARRAAAERLHGEFARG